jgi:FkbM family methyltransferase
LIYALKKFFDTNYNVKLLIFIEIIKMISILKKTLPKKFKTFLKKFRKFNSINNLDKKLLKYLNFKDGFYIECGANDGVNQSNTWYFEKILKWRGILIEPNEKLFKNLKNNRSSKNIFKNVALVSEDFKNKNEEIYLSENNLESKLTNVKNPTNQKVVTETLNNILKEFNVNKINFFSLDVEGYEEEVLRGLNLNIFDIDYILIETNNFDKINIMLKNSNYTLQEKLSFHDYLFKKNKHQKSL